jgi:hypothetical protein
MIANSDILDFTLMDDANKALNVIEALRAAKRQPAQTALPILNGLVGLSRGDSVQRLEVEDARANTFMAICEVAKALHRGTPADQLWALAIAAAERWISLV